MYRQLVTLGTIGLCCLAFGMAGCKEKDAAKCSQGQEGVRKSAAAGDDALLTKWRNWSYKYCEDTAALSAIDQEIAQQRATAAKAKAEAERQQRENDQLLALFLGWVGQNRAAPEQSATAVACDGGKDEEKSLERWCVRNRRAGTHQLNVRYWDQERVAASFDTALPEAITCEKLGTVRVIRTWTIPGQQIKRSHCEITAGPLAGMQAMVSEARNAPLHVFTTQYVERTANLKAKLASEGL